MKKFQPVPTPLSMTKRGRPEVTDRTKLKNRTMTICLTTELHKKLTKLAGKNKQKPAAMARILIESGVDVK